MHELLLTGGSGLFCMLLVLGHFLVRGRQLRSQTNTDSRDHGPAHEARTEPLQDFR